MNITQDSPGIPQWSINGEPNVLIDWRPRPGPKNELCLVIYSDRSGTIEWNVNQLEEILKFMREVE